MCKKDLCLLLLRPFGCLEVIFDQLIDDLANRLVKTDDLFLGTTLFKVPPFDKQENVLKDVSFADDNSRGGGNPFQETFIDFLFASIRSSSACLLFDDI